MDGSGPHGRLGLFVGGWPSLPLAAGPVQSHFPTWTVLHLVTIFEIGEVLKRFSHFHFRAAPDPC